MTSSTIQCRGGVIILSKCYTSSDLVNREHDVIIHSISWRCNDGKYDPRSPGNLDDSTIEHIIILSALLSDRTFV